MHSKIYIPSPLRKFSEGNTAVEVKGNTIQAILDDLFSSFPEMHHHIIDKRGSLRSFVNIFVDREDVRTLNGLETPVEEGAEIRIIPAIAGGRELPELSPQEMSRYSRHFTLPEVGIEGQKKLKSAKALVVGLGGLGCPVVLYLAAGGIGTIGMVDFDSVDESNLQRQILYGVDHIGRLKLEIARERLSNFNPHVNLVLHKEQLTSKNALKIINDYDMVIDGTDNFPTRYLVNDACVLLNKPNVYGSIFRFDGQASVFHYKGGPCYRCLYPEPPPPGLVPSCAEGGVLGVLPGIIGSIQANEAIKIILELGETLNGRFLLFDALAIQFTELKIQRDENCVVCGDNPSITGLIDYEEFCGIHGRHVESVNNEITVHELKSRINKSETLKIIDVREAFELQIAQIPGVVHIPKNEIPFRLGELDPEEELIIMCRTGVRSANVCEFLKERNYKNARNLVGGIRAWSKEIDSSVPIY